MFSGVFVVFPKCFLGSAQNFTVDGGRLHGLFPIEPRRRYLSLISTRQQHNFVSRLGIYMPLFHVLTAAVDDVEIIGPPRRGVEDFSGGVFDRKIAAFF
jgi:hypothetical protein